MPRRSARLAKKRESKLKKEIVESSDSELEDQYEPTPTSESEAEAMGIKLDSDHDWEVYKCPSDLDDRVRSEEDSDYPSCSSEPPRKRRRLSCPMTPSPMTPISPITPITSIRLNRGGFSTKAKALQTVAFIKGRDVRYQTHMIKAFHRGACSILRKAKTKKKTDDIKGAIQVFEGWLDDFESRKDHIENFDHLQLSVIEQFEELVDLYNSEERKREEMEYDPLLEIEMTYLRVFQRLNGEIGALRSTPISDDIDRGEDCDCREGDGGDREADSHGISWDIARNIKLVELKGKLTEQDLRCNGMMRTVDEALLYYKRGKLKGFPSRIHLQMIMYGYSPHKNVIKKLAKSVAKTVSTIQDGYSSKC